MSLRLAESTIDPAAEPARPSPAVLWLGDVLVTFGADGPPADAPPARRPDAPFSPVASGAMWRVWESSPSAAWRGAPVMRLAADDWRGWLLGELYATAQPASDALAVLSGRASPNRLNGHFLLLGHDTRADEWHAWTNRHASFHAYFASDGRRAALGTCFRATARAAARADLDWEGLTTFLGFGFCAADRTFLADVRVLRPATHYRFDARGRLLADERYWQWQRQVDTARSPAATLAEYADRFQTVMDDLLADGRVAVPISGGLDSRSTVAAIDSAREPANRLWAYSYGYQPDSVETRIAAQVAAARALPFEAFTIRPYLFPAFPRVLSSIEGFQEVTMARQASVVDALARHSDYLIAAHWGDVYHDAMGVADTTPPAGLPAVAYHKFIKPGSAWLLRHVSAPHLRPVAPEEVLRAVVADELARIGPLDEPDFAIKALKVDQYGPRMVSASLRMFQSAAFPRLPFYDARLTDFFGTVPTAAVAGRRLQIDYLKRYAPDLARVPWQETGRDLFSGGFAPLALAGRAARKVGRTLSGRRVIERNWEVQFLGDDGRAALRDWLLRPGRQLHEYVPVAAIRDLLAAFERDPWGERRGAAPKPAYAVSALLTLSAWFDYMAGELDE